MNKILIVLFSLLMSTALMAQAPQKINYQAVARDLAGNPLINTIVNVSFDIKQSSASGVVVYSETHTGTTNGFGLFTLEIGGGTATLGTFTGINWGANMHYLQVTVNGDVMQATQLLSVPYALHAGTAASGTPGVDGIHCWDLNGNGFGDLATEDINGDLVVNVLDCKGNNGVAGANGSNGISISWQGTHATPLSTPNLNEAYYNSTDGIAYIWDGSLWQTLAKDGIGSAFVAGPGVSIVGNTISVTDTSVTNELQTISLNSTNDTIFLTNGGFVAIPPLVGDNWGTDTVVTSGTNVSGQGTVGSPLIITDNDGDPTNELELPMTGNTVGDVLKWNGTAWVSGIDGDNSGTNELQDLSWDSSDSNFINISNGTGLALSSNPPSFNQVLTWDGANWIAQNSGAGADNWGTQTVVTDATLSGDGTIGTPLSGFDGQYSNLTGAPTNVTSFTNDAGYLIPPTLSTGEYLFWNGTNWLGNVPSTGTDNQNLSLSGNILSLTNDPTTVDLSPYLDNTDSQNLTNTIAGSNATINISGGTGTTFSLNDADADASNEIQTLSFSTPNLSISGSGGNSVDLSSLITNDGDWTIFGNNISSAVIGDVGIGLTNPVNKLHIHEPSAVATSMSLTNTATGSAGTDGFVIAAGNTGRALLMNREATEMIFYTSNIDRMTIDAAGEVGIGTINPSSDLHVYKSSGAGTIMLESPVAGNLQYGIKNTNTEYALELNGINFHIQQAGSNLMTFSGGDVGIGMTPSNSQLDVNGQITMQDGFQAPGYIPVSDANGTMTWTDPSSLSSSFWKGVTASPDIYFNSGRVGIGTNAPNFNLEVSNTITDRGAYIVTSGRNSNSYKIGVTGITQNGSGTGSNVGGVFNAINGTGGDNIAIEAYTQNGVADIYGLRSFATTNTSTGTSYGVYSTATGAATNWAGYFVDGNIYVKDNMSIGTETTRFVSGANNTLLVATSNTASQSYSSIELKSYSAAQNAPGSEINFIREHSGSNNYHLGRIRTRSYGAADEGVLLLGVSNGANNIIDRISIDNAGHVGIGSQSYSNLNAQLHVTNSESTADGETGVFTYIQNMAATSSAGANGIISGMRFGVTNYAFDNYYKGGILFESNGATNGLGDMHFAVNGAADNTNAGVSNAVMTLASSGHAGIGETNPAAGLQVNDVSADPALRIQKAGITRFMVANNGFVTLNYNLTPSYSLHMNTNSAAKPTSNVWTVASDARLKKDVKPFEGGLDDILKINPVWFTYNGKAGMPKDKGVGVIAQDLQKVAPYMINTWTYTEGSMDENNPRTDGEKTEYFGVDNGAMTYMLINAVKEQQKMIEELKKEIEGLKKK